MNPAPPAVDTPVTVLRAPSRWPPLALGEVWADRELLLTLALRDVKLRYRQTALGVFWVVLQPLLAATILAFVFGRVAGVTAGGVSHFAFAFAGFLAWSAFAASLNRSAPAIVQNVALVSKVFFPRLVLPLSASLASLVDAGVGLLLATAVVAAGEPGRLAPTLLATPFFLLTAALLGAGVGLGASALMVPFRDVQHVLPVFVQLTLFASPVAYPVAAVPEPYRPLFQLNPLAGLGEGLRWSLLGLPPASWPAIAYAVAVSLVLFLAGVLVFRSLEHRFADVI